MTIPSTNQAVSAKDLWEKIITIITDSVSVSKNLNFEDRVADVLKSNYKLCKSYLVETFDRSNTEVLSTIENQLNFREELESINSSIRSFLRGEKMCDSLWD